MLTHYQTGEYAPPNSRAGWFSQDNYSNTVVFRNGKAVKDNRLSRIMGVINDLNHTEWRLIHEGAYAVVIRRQEAGKVKRRQAARKSVEAVEAAVAEDDDDGLMLVED